MPSGLCYNDRRISLSIGAFNVKRRIICIILLFVLAFTMTSCSGDGEGWYDDLLKSVNNNNNVDDSDDRKNARYEISPGKQADFERTDRGEKIISPEITEIVEEKRVIQQPAAFFLKETRGTSPGEQGAEYVFSSGARAYMNLLTEHYGFELIAEYPNYVYNTYYFVHPDSNKETDAYGNGYDVWVRHYYDASTSTVNDWLTVKIDTDLFCFADEGLRYNESLEREVINGEYARDAFLFKNGKYYNSSDKALSVTAGVKKETLYTYTKPFASKFYGFYGYDGSCALIINGGRVKEYDGLISDYEDFDSDNTDMIFVSKDDGSKLVGITWKHKAFEVGRVYDLADFLESSFSEFYFNYDYNEFDENDAICLTVRPLWIDRTGAGESVVYFYGEFANSDGEIYTVEGLLAAPFNLEENSEKYTSGSSGGSSYPGVPDAGDPYIPDFAKQDCLTCGGDGDCNSCNGYGTIERYSPGGSVTSNCPYCYGSGNCRTCGGSGKR